MKIVYRYSLANDVVDRDRRNTLLVVYGTLSADAKIALRHGHTATARTTAKLCRDMVAAFGSRHPEQRIVEV